MSLLNEYTSRVASCLERLAGSSFDIHTSSTLNLICTATYTTIGRYARDSQGLLFPSLKGVRGHFDIAIINRLHSKRYDMKHQRALIAVELGLDEDITYFKNDLMKLTDARNDVKQGFSAHFARKKTIPVDEYQAMKDLLEANPQIGSLIIDRSKRKANVYNRLVKETR